MNKNLKSMNQIKISLLLILAVTLTTFAVAQVSHNQTQQVPNKIATYKTVNGEIVRHIHATNQSIQRNGNQVEIWKNGEMIEQISYQEFVSQRSE